MGFALSPMQITSPAFEPLGRIPKKHTGEGPDVSPALAWSGAPKEAKSYALVCHDPDAPLVTADGYGFVHWVLYNIPASVTKLAEGEKGYTNGATSFGKPKYGGPLPPEGHGVHHYYFWLLALKVESKLKPGLTMRELLATIEPNVIAMNRLVGTYSRPS
ncbi:MAG TPA: YbhB/YbcL family Raf kinase inhibitor-like protein [Gammaproteobacteria bacterium]|nr:YbhB/YbcL family Raf kinase inhibitor-like protein [Gammaproteobacteria bacterium]